MGLNDFFNCVVYLPANVATQRRSLYKLSGSFMTKLPDNIDYSKHICVRKTLDREKSKFYVYTRVKSIIQSGVEMSADKEKKGFMDSNDLMEVHR